MSHKQTARFTPQNGIAELSWFLAPFRQYTVLKKHEDFLRLYRIYKKSRSQAKREDARRRLIYGNVLLVVPVARRNLRHGLPLLDMMQEGLLGIAKALDLFDEKFGCHFSTYAIWWIRAYIRRAIINLNAGNVFRIPINVEGAKRHVSFIITTLQHEGHVWPTVDEVGIRLRASTNKTAREIPLSHVPDLMKLAMSQPLRLDAPILNANGESAAHAIIADSSVDIEQDVETNLLAERLQRLMRSRLTPKEYFVLYHRFGIDGSGCWTLAEISQTFNLTRERIRQIEQEAMHKLRIAISQTEARHWQELAESL